MKNYHYFALGVFALLFVKYVLFGLFLWNQALHPMRIDDAGSRFYKPFLGVFS